MDETVCKIAMAGFFHDIGKLVDREIMDISQEYIDNHSGLYLPFFNGRYTHHHAVYTAAFIEQMGEWLPEEFNSPGWGEGDSFINLAAGHHKPETPMQWIIALADRISSGFDRAEFDEKYNKAVSPKNYRSTRLVPVFEHLSPEAGNPPETADAYTYCYPLRAISPESIFPGLKTEVYPKDNSEAKRDYQALFDGFTEGLKGLYHKRDNISLWFEHVESLAMIHASAVPAARAGHVIPDVSLYDHLKTTSAIASALYLFHKQTDSMTVEEINDEKNKKFLIVSGDFYGIQNFIFSSGESQKNRSKMLRGRSFAVSLFSELAADMLCREIGIPSTSVVLNAAGKFTLIAPNTDKTRTAVSSVEQAINKWLIRVSFGETTMGITHVEAAAHDFVRGRFETLWDKLQDRVDRKKFQKIDLSRFGGAVTGYLDSFDNSLDSPLCPFCRRRPSNPATEGSHFAGESSCSLCRDHIYLGENLVKNTLVAVVAKDADIRGGDDNRLLEPIFGQYQVVFPDGALTGMAKNGTLLKYWDVSTDMAEMMNRNVTARFINGYIPVCQQEDLEDNRLFWGKKAEDKKLEQIEQVEPGMPKTFGHIANKALHIKDDKCMGVEALGVLKADVDNLGLLISCGIKGELFTLSRLATLSRQLNYYFSVYLPHLLMNEPEFKDVYTVFAGGDDLFLIGPWNRIIKLAKQIQTSFSEYVCNNPDIHLSAGISLHKPNSPVGFMASSAESAMESAKDNGRNRVTIFSETVSWDEMAKLNEIQKEIEKWLEKKWVNPAMLYRLNQVMKMAGEENRLVKNREIHLEDMGCTKWRSLLSYSIARNTARELAAEERPEVVEHVRESLGKWLSEYGEKLKIPVWSILYNRRSMKI